MRNCPECSAVFSKIKTHRKQQEHGNSPDPRRRRLEPFFRFTLFARDDAKMILLTSEASESANTPFASEEPISPAARQVSPQKYPAKGIFLSWGSVSSKQNFYFFFVVSLLAGKICVILIALMCFGPSTKYTCDLVSTLDTSTTAASAHGYQSTPPRRNTSWRQSHEKMLRTYAISLHRELPFCVPETDGNDRSPDQDSNLCFRLYLSKRLFPAVQATISVLPSWPASIVPPTAPP